MGLVHAAGLLQQAPFASSLDDPVLRQAITGLHDLSYTQKIPPVNFQIGGPEKVPEIAPPIPTESSQLLPALPSSQGTFGQGWATTLNGFIFLSFCVLYLRYRLYRESHKPKDILSNKADIPTVTTSLVEEIEQVPTTEKTVRFASDEVAEPGEPEVQDTSLEKSVSQDGDGTKRRRV